MPKERLLKEINHGMPTPIPRVCQIVDFETKNDADEANILIIIYCNY